MIIVDTGPLYALADRRDTYHAACSGWLKYAEGPLLVPPPVIAEVCHLMEYRLNAEVEASFLESIGPGRPFRLTDLTDEDIDRMAVLVRQYADFPLGGTDASVIAVAERLGVDQVATVDRRHFSAVRPRHVPSFRLLPEQL